MKRLGIILTVSVLICLSYVFLPTLIWDGEVARQFRFHLVESGSNRAVRDAKIQVVRDSRLQSLSDTNFAAMFPAVTTDAGGLARVSVMCGAGGAKRLFGKSGGFVISHELLVEANGYRPVCTGLANVVGGRRWPLSKRVFDVELVLFKNP